MITTAAVDVSVIDRESLAAVQRARVLVAMVDTVAERDLSGATVARVTAKAGVSRRTFYELFEDREACYLAALDDAIDRAAKSVIPAYESGRDCLERLRLGTSALLGFIDADPHTGWLLIVSSLAGGPDALGRRQVVLERIAKVVDRALRKPKATLSSPLLTAEAVVGGALAVIHTRIVEGSLVSELQAELMSTIVMPYLGQAAARRELEHTVPNPPASSQRADGEVLRDLGMRVTYRTVRVLIHLAQHPGSSNSQVAAAVGINDPGQISKLLSRLQRRELLENTGGPRSRGAPNAWRLTPKGRDIGAAVSIFP